MSRRKKKQRRDMRKGIYILPNLFTTASLFTGFYSLVSTLEGRFMAAAVAIIISAIFDGLDGKVARLTKTTSQFGVEYDSLADLVAFGVAPGLLAYTWALQPYGRLGWVVAFIYVACGALRLARFNVNTSTRDPEFFQGLAIPAAACMVSVTVFWFSYWGQTGHIKNNAVLVLIFVLSFLMVSNFRYFSLKNPALFKSKPFNTMVLAVLIFALVAVQPKIVLFVIGLCYLASGPIMTLVHLREVKRLRLLGIEPNEGQPQSTPPAQQ
ncbi:MAG: CDP-diacylglycerol--serine O-phosphatidyltransferase [Thermodesulfobacteriota bacterium]